MSILSYDVETFKDSGNYPYINKDDHIFYHSYHFFPNMDQDYTNTHFFLDHLKLLLLNKKES
jgi:hypothetical protein